MWKYLINERRNNALTLQPQTQLQAPRSGTIREYRDKMEEIW